MLSLILKYSAKFDPNQASQMTALGCQTMEMVLCIPADKTYVTYQGISDWGWNWKNF